MLILSKKKKWQYDPTIMQMLKDRCDKLEKDNRRLRGELEAVRHYKEEYEDLIASTKMIKKRYEHLVERGDNLLSLFEGELDGMKKMIEEETENE